MMNRFSGSWLMMLFFALQTVALTGQTEVPDVVQFTFDEMFPDAEDVNWDEDGREYMASFSYYEHSVEANFLEDGDWLQTATFIELEELPADAKSVINNKFKEPEYYSTLVKMETPGNLHYLVNFETETQTVSLKFDEFGKLLKKEIEDF